VEIMWRSWSTRPPESGIRGFDPAGPGRRSPQDKITELGKVLKGAEFFTAERAGLTSMIHRCDVLS